MYQHLYPLGLLAHIFHHRPRSLVLQPFPRTHTSALSCGLLHMLAASLVLAGSLFGLDRECKPPSLTWVTTLVGWRALLASSTSDLPLLLRWDHKCCLSLIASPRLSSCTWLCWSAGSGSLEMKGKATGMRVWAMRKLTFLVSSRIHAFFYNLT